MKSNILLALLVPLSIAGALAAGPGVFDLYYSSAWSSTYLHYNADGRGWNSIPGTPAGPSTNESYPSPPWVFVEVSGGSLNDVDPDHSEPG